MRARNVVAMLAACVSLPGCGETPTACTDVPRWALDVAIINGETDTPAAVGASVIAATDTYSDSLVVSANVPSVRVGSEGPAGTYTLRVRKPGFAPVQQQVIVPGGPCGAEMTDVVVYLFAFNQ